jgi:DNA-binding winged helix-turn-helix (wHTH) protein
MIYAFGPFELDDSIYELRCHGTCVPLQRRAFDFLAHLVRHADVVCTQSELRAKVWGGAVVTKDAIAHAAVAVRTALQDDGTYIRTVRGRGYRFGVRVEVRSQAGGAAPPSWGPEKTEKTEKPEKPEKTEKTEIYEQIARVALVI